MCSLVACTTESFACREADECSLGGEPGLCLAGNCAYPDDACESGYRYAAGLHSAFAGECVPEDDVDDDEVPEESAGSTGGSSTTANTRAGSDESSDASADESSDESTTSGELSSTALTDFDPGTSSGSDAGESSSSSGPPIACEDESCARCFACVVEPAQACAMLDGECDDATDCAVSATCMQSCAVKGLCLDDCCDGVESTEAAMAHDLHACRAEACATACLDLPEPACGS